MVQGFLPSLRSSFQHGAALDFWSPHAASFPFDVCCLRMMIFSRLYVIVALLCITKFVSITRLILSSTTRQHDSHCQ